MGQQSPPSPPNPAQTYAQGITTQLHYLPQMLRAEEAARLQYDPQRILEQQYLQALFGPSQYGQQLQALQQLDPASYAIRNQLGESVSRDLALGGQLSPEMEKQLESQVRGAQTVRGNYLGDAPANAEALWKGQAALNLYQQRLQNAGNFLSSPTPEQQLALVQPVSADRSFSYVNPSAGLQGQQLGLQNYQNLLAAYQLSGGNRSPWGLIGGLAGTAAGAYFGGPAGAQIGGAAGSAAGSYFSDRRLKRNIVEIGKTEDGIPIVLFDYVETEFTPKGRWKGVLADDVMKIKPEAVSYLEGTDLMLVDYSKLSGVKLEAVTDAP